MQICLTRIIFVSAGVEKQNTIQKIHFFIFKVFFAKEEKFVKEIQVKELNYIKKRKQNVFSTTRSNKTGTGLI